MKKLIIFPILAMFLLTNNIYSQVTQEWAARYNGPGNISDFAHSIAVDGSGNVYVTGESFGSGTDYDYATIKYNSSGVIMWKARYNGPENADDHSRSIAVDGSGNVYVTGYSLKSGVNYDYITIKYNTWGVQQWVQRYNSPETADDRACSLALDGLGNIYVTGYSYGGGTNCDCITIKYNSSGGAEWVQRYDGGYGGDQPKSIAVDGSGNVYVTGDTYAGGTSSDYLTIKYNSSGVLQWVNIYNGTGNFTDLAFSVAVDISGNVYVTGQSWGSGTGYDYATIKYNSSGTQLWVSSYNGPGNGSDAAVSIAADGSGNVYVTGSSYGSGTDVDYATIKYNSSGVQQWVQRYNNLAGSFDAAGSIALDLSGNVYVSGQSWGSGTGYDYATIKYNSSGVQQWVQRYDGPGNHTDATKSIAVDVSGNVYVTGLSYGGGTGLDYATIKYSQAAKKLIGGIPLSDSYLPELPANYTLEQNYPNPFNPSTTIKFSLPAEDNVVINVSDINGKEVSQLLNNKMAAGYHEISFDGSNLSSGIYFYKITTSDFTDVKKMILIK